MSKNDKAPKNPEGRYTGSPNRTDPNQTIGESLSQLPPAVREKIEKGMTEGFGATPFDIGEYMRHHQPLTVENIASAVVDELVRRGYFPEKPEVGE